jgi:hypothetical protein
VTSSRSVSRSGFRSVNYTPRGASLQAAITQIISASNPYFHASKTVHTVYIVFSEEEMSMSDVTSDKATKKSARIPKHANGHTAVEISAPPAVSSPPVGKRGKTARNTRGTPGGSVAAEAAPLKKAKRPKKGKVVRDTFTMSESDSEKLVKLKQKCRDAGVAVKKSELLRAGLLMLESAPTKRLLAAVAASEALETDGP